MTAAGARRKRREVAIGGMESLRAWIVSRGWRPFVFQEESWAAHQRGESGLINVPTGAGKTYAAYLGPLAEVVDEARGDGCAAGNVEGLRILFITPLRAVSRDIEAALKEPVEALGLAKRVRVESRTGDTSSSVRARQRQQLPAVLITTPESLSLLLSLANSRELFAGLRSVIADEWHELLSSKRGTQTELALARLRRISSGVRVWGLSATLANLDEAAAAVVGVREVHHGATESTEGTEGSFDFRSHVSGSSGGSEKQAAGFVDSPSPGCSVPRIIRADIARPISIMTVIPEDPARLPWAGHLGMRMLPDLLGVLDPERSTLIFTNTRSQAEMWYQALRFSRPEWAGVMALHHGSIDRKERERVERGLKSGTVRLVVCTSSLDLGVDFAPVERVVQIGSPKGVARLMQRAGRSGHRPGAECTILCVPTHAMELVEVASVRRAIAEGEIEARVTLSKPLDVLAQHLVTCALGGGFAADEMYDEVRSAWTYRQLTRQEFEWALALVREGGGTLRAYPQFHKVVLEAGADGVARHVVADKRIAQLHRLNIGTITGDATVTLKYTSGRMLGSIEEAFVAMLRPGDRFFFAGRTLEFVRLSDLEAFVRPARGKSNYTPRWSGTKLPISESLSEEMRRVMGAVGAERRDGERRDGEINDEGRTLGMGAGSGGEEEKGRRGEEERKRRVGSLKGRPTGPGAAGEEGELEPELRAAMAFLRVQARVSRIPEVGTVLVELLESREGFHLFMFPFEGRLVHGGLAALLALRMSRVQRATFSLSVNDYGLELLSADPMPYEAMLTPELFSEEGLARDAVESVNISALARSQFREIARVAGLVFQTYPGARKSGRQLHASSSLLFDVFSEFDPQNLLLEQARREVLERHFEESRLARTLERVRESKLLITRPAHPTPLGFPLMLERFGEKMSNQTILERLEKMRAEWLDGPAPVVEKAKRVMQRRSLRR